MPNIFKNDIITKMILDFNIVLYDGMPAACVLKSFADAKFANFTKLNGIGHETDVKELYNKFLEVEPTAELILCEKMPIHLIDLEDYRDIKYIKIILHRKNQNDVIIKLTTFNDNIGINKIFNEIAKTVIFDYGLLAMRKMQNDDTVIFQKNINKELILYKELYYLKLDAVIFSLTSDIESVINNLVEHIVEIRSIHHNPIPRYEHIIYALLILKVDVKFYISEINICYSIQKTNVRCLLCKQVKCEDSMDCIINQCHSSCFIKDIKLKQKKGIYQSLVSIDNTIKCHKKKLSLDS